MLSELENFSDDAMRYWVKIDRIFSPKVRELDLAGRLSVSGSQACYVIALKDVDGCLSRRI
jgi:hypothetical protein